MNETVFIAATMIPATLLAISLYWVDVVRRKERLFRWASKNNLKLNKFRYPLVIERSAFPFSVSHSQHVFRVEVEEVDGTVRQGWVTDLQTLGEPARECEDDAPVRQAFFRSESRIYRRARCKRRWCCRPSCGFACLRTCAKTKTPVLSFTCLAIL